jgi:hypothetical protein
MRVLGKVEAIEELNKSDDDADSIDEPLEKPMTISKPKREKSQAQKDAWERC